MRHLLGKRWPPDQLAPTLGAILPKGHEHHVSHEAIYNCIYAQLVGELRREPIANLRHAHAPRLAPRH
jgi:IS30 family transposase